MGRREGGEEATAAKKPRRRASRSSESTRADRRLSVISGRFLSSNKAFGLGKTTRLEHRWEQIVGRVFCDRNADALRVESNSFFHAGDCSEMEQGMFTSGVGYVSLNWRRFELPKFLSRQLH